MIKNDQSISVVAEYYSQKNQFIETLMKIHEAGIPIHSLINSESSDY